MASIVYLNQEILSNGRTIWYEWAPDKNHPKGGARWYTWKNPNTPFYGKKGDFYVINGTMLPYAPSVLDFLSDRSWYLLTAPYSVLMAENNAR